MLKEKLKYNERSKTKLEIYLKCKNEDDILLDLK